MNNGLIIYCFLLKYYYKIYYTMMDYYGGITKDPKEIDSELIKKFRDRCEEYYIKNIISTLRKENILKSDYSVTGWGIYNCKDICNIIDIRLIASLKKKINILKFTYCYLHNNYEDIDICQLICTYII